MLFRQKPKLLIILGPTAVGKTALSIEAAKVLAGEIISADSMQVYKGMNIGTAKPGKKEFSQILHHLIDIILPSKEWSVADFIERANELIPRIIKRGSLPIIVGGTGLYLNAFLEGFEFPIIPANKVLREALEKEAQKLGSETLHKRLKKVDKKAAEKINPNDLKRIIRALEVYEQTGKPISKLQKKRPATKKYNIKIIGLNMDRKKLYKRIEERVDNMIKAGLIDEVKRLIDAGYSKNLPSMQALGYKEAIGYLEGKYGKEEMIKLLKKNTRNFARRQLVWFRRLKDVKWLDVEKEKDLLGSVLQYIKFSAT